VRIPAGALLLQLPPSRPPVPLASDPWRGRWIWLWQPPCQRPGPCLACSPDGCRAQMPVVCMPVGTHWRWIWCGGHRTRPQWAGIRHFRLAAGHTPAILAVGKTELERGRGWEAEAATVGFVGRRSGPLPSLVGEQRRRPEAWPAQAVVAAAGVAPLSRLRETTWGSPYMLFFRLVWICDK
jgi:hypothetical protein